MINEKGYLRPTYEELLEQRIERAKELWGDDIDTENNSPLGKFIRLAVQDLEEVYLENEMNYYSHSPSTATGQNLDRLMPFANIKRNPATRAEHVVRFTGTAEYEVPVGFLVGTKGELEFYLVDSVVLDAEGNGEGIVQCTELGTVGNVQLGAITEIINPDADVSGVLHVDIELLGEDEESDVELRNRFKLAVEGSGSGTAAAIRGAVMRVTGVKSCVVIENDDDVADYSGRPPHSFETYVHAPETVNPDVAAAIFSKKPVGIKSYGTDSETVIDVQGSSKVVYFSRVADIALRIKLTVATDTHFELQGAEQIKSALIEYVNSLKAGEDVVYTNLYRYIYGVNGVKDVPSLTLSTDGASYKAESVIIDKQQIVTLEAENIEIEVTAYADR